MRDIRITGFIFAAITVIGLTLLGSNVTWGNSKISASDICYNTEVLDIIQSQIKKVQYSSTGGVLDLASVGGLTDSNQTGLYHCKVDYNLYIDVLKTTKTGIINYKIRVYDNGTMSYILGN
jgi:hypothetical protein